MNIGFLCDEQNVKKKKRKNGDTKFLLPNYLKKSILQKEKKPLETKLSYQHEFIKKKIEFLLKHTIYTT